MPYDKTKKKKRRIKKAKIRMISLCPRGANQLPTIYKEDGTFDLQTLVKVDEELGEVTAIVYAPEFRDSQGDIASAEVIKQMAYEFQRDGGEIDIRHDNEAVGRDRAFVAESFIVQKDDARFAGQLDYEGNPVDVTGAWAVVLKIDDPELRSLYTNDGWKGVSMAGTAEVEIERSQPTRPSVADRLSESFRNEESPMTDEDLAKIGDLIDSKLKEALHKEETPATTNEDEDDTPTFEGDPTNVEDLEKHRDALRKHSLQKRLAKAKSADEVEAILKEIKGTDEEPKVEKSDEVSRLEKELAKARAASAQPTQTTSSTTKASLAKRMAAHASRR